MAIKNKVVTMLLAGGQGSRLKTMTSKMAKPAVPYGGKYRIIDFALSNSTNSGIRDIGILTQYKPFKLNEHIGIGSAWDYDRNIGGLRLLSPFTSEEGGRWYTGTANAIYENINYLDQLECEYVLILSGDHIYKMDYDKLIRYHKEKGSHATVAVIKVPIEEASRFGIVNTDENMQIIEFEEKPPHPKSNVASMGIYVFNWEILRKFLIEDGQNRQSEHDFGKNILPKMLLSKEPMFAYVFSGYWKDVGTVKSYWESNMDLLDIHNGLNLRDKRWRIFTKTLNLPPQYIHPSSDVKNSLINEGCDIAGKVKNSVLFSNVKIEQGAEVVSSVIMSNCIIKKGARLSRCVVIENVTIEENVILGNEQSESVFLVSENEVIEE